MPTARKRLWIKASRTTDDTKEEVAELIGVTGGEPLQNDEVERAIGLHTGQETEGIPNKRFSEWASGSHSTSELLVQLDLSGGWR